jgi:hypothetical protein
MEEPMIKVVRGNPTPEELAALVAVLAARAAGGGEAAPPEAPSAWRDPARRVRRPLRPGPGAWRASAWPL